MLKLYETLKEKRIASAKVVITKFIETEKVGDDCVERPVYFVEMNYSGWTTYTIYHTHNLEDAFRYFDVIVENFENAVTFYESNC